MDGTPEFKQAIPEKFRSDNGLDYAGDEIAVAAGAKEVLFYGTDDHCQPRFEGLRHDRLAHRLCRRLAPIDQGNGGGAEPSRRLARHRSAKPPRSRPLSPQQFLSERAESFCRRRDVVVAGLNTIAGLDCRVPEGAFFAFAGCAGLIGQTTPAGRRSETDTDFCDYLLEEAQVAVVPGAAFGLSPFFRFPMRDTDRC